MPWLDSPKVGRRLLLAASRHGNGEHQNQNNTTLESCFMHDHVEPLQEHFSLRSTKHLMLCLLMALKQSCRVRQHTEDR